MQRSRLTLGTSAVVASAVLCMTGATQAATPSAGNAASDAPSLSANGRFVAFESSASNLVAADTNGRPDVFVTDRRTGTTQRMSVSTSGQQADGASGQPSISADGRYVVFSSGAANLVPGDTNGKPDIFRRDRRTGMTSRVSVATDGTQANGESSDPQISADGENIVFGSRATNLIPSDTNGVQDVFLRSLASGSTIRVSVTSAEEQVTRASSRPTVSGDGSLVAFSSNAHLTARPAAGVTDWYGIDLRDRTTHTTSLRAWADVDDDCAAAIYPPDLSANGRSLIFRTITGCDTDQNHLYQDRLDGAAGHEIRPADELYGTFDGWDQDATGRFVAYHESSDGGTRPTTRHLLAVRNWVTGAETTLRAPWDVSSIALSGDAGTVAFATSAALVAGDTNSTDDVYTWTPSTGSVALVS